tara:strand:+ start:23550 stop:23660 length:111 start_codon:yes stop_codon:yes gene_type:complete
MILYLLPDDELDELLEDLLLPLDLVMLPEELLDLEL